MLLHLLLLSVRAGAVEHTEVGLAAEETLEYVHSVWRHGDRTPAELLYPEDIVKWPEGLGELTARGAQQQFRLGQWLRKRYGQWLGHRFDRNAIYVRSSDYNRTLMSAMANMAGLFPTREPIGDGLLWQPVPVHTRPKPSDKELYEEIKCPVAESEMEGQWRSERADRVREEFARELNFLSTKLDLPNIVLKDTWRIFDNFFCEKQHNVSWPNWMNESLFARVDRLYNEVSKLEFHTEKLRRLRGGTLLEEIFQRFHAKVDGSLGDQAKFFAYSAVGLDKKRKHRRRFKHDATVAALLSTFGIFYEIYPKYATCLLIELHRQPNGTRVVRVFHKNETDVDRLIEYSIPGCDSPCTLQKLAVDLSKYFPDDWENECGLKSNYEFWYLTLIFSLLITTTCSFTMFVLEKKRKKIIKYSTLAREDVVPMLEMADSD